MRLNRFLVGAVSIAMALASCEKSDAPGTDNGEVVAGIPTMARIVLSQSAPISTRAAVAVPTTEESKVNSARVFIFAEGSLASINDLTVDNVNNTATATFATTTGRKQIFATANIPDTKLKGIAVGMRLAEVKEQLINIAAMADLATDNAFWMTNVEDAPIATVVQADQTAVANGANNFTIEIGRASAKVNLELKATAQQIGGALANVEYRVRNNPKRMYSFPVFNGNQLMTPYYALDWTTDKVNENDADDGLTPQLAGFVGKKSYFGNGDAAGGVGNPTFTATGTATYMMENSNAVAMKGKATYLSIKGVWTPNADATFLKADGTPATLADMPANKDFWRIATLDGDGKITGYENGIYVAAPTAGAAQKVVAYIGGVSYYGMWIADNRIPVAARKYAIKRNSYYDVGITDVSGPGAATEGDVVPDPEAPVESDAFMKAEIKILEWNIINQEGGI